MALKTHQLSHIQHERHYSVYECFENIISVLCKTCEKLNVTSLHKINLRPTCALVVRSWIEHGLVVGVTRTD